MGAAGLARAVPRPTGHGLLWGSTMLIPLVLFLKHDLQVPGLVFCLLLQMWAVGGIACGLNLRGVRVTRAAPERIGAGEPFLLVWTFENPAGRFGAEGIEVRPPRGTGRPFRVSAVPPGGQVVHASMGAHPRRGVHDLPAAILRSSAPLGFFRRSIVRDAPCRLVVTPRLGRFVAPRGSGAGEEDPRADAVSGAGTAPGAIPRDYAPGDPARWIRWRPTARRGVLTVVPPEHTPPEPVTLALDLRLAPGAPRRARSLFERAVSVAATLLVEMRDAGTPVSLSWAGCVPDGTPPSPGDAPLGAQLDALAAVGPGPAGGSPPVPPARGIVVTSVPGPRARGVLCVSDRSFAQEFRYAPRPRPS